MGHKGESTGGAFALPPSLCVKKGPVLLNKQISVNVLLNKQMSMIV